MATLGPTALPERSPEKRHYPEKQRSKAFRTMTDQQNFEAPQPASADPAVALAEMLGQLPNTPVDKAPLEKPKPKTSVAEPAKPPASSSAIRTRSPSAASSAARAIHSFAPTAP